MPKENEDTKDRQIKELEEKLKQSEKLVERIMHDQESAAKLLVRRDLALSRANTELEALDIAKSEFISIAAHQLRTPLSAIKWILNMAQNKEFKSEGDSMNFLKKASDSTERMITLVNDLLQVDHIQSGKEPFVFSKVNIFTIIETVLGDMSGMIQNKKIKVNFEMMPQSFVNGDPGKIRTLFQNIIENSVKYTREGGEIFILSEPEGGFILFEIRDNGIGIPKDQQDRLFTKFFRTENAMRMDTVGSGLGLFIAKQIVVRHGGKIWFESMEGKGTTFFILLPM